MATAILSCEKAVDIDVPFETPKLVLNGFLNPDSSISVHVSKSQFILDEAELQNITDATVRVYEEGQFLGDLKHKENGLYKLEGIFPKAGKEYTIQAEKSGFASVKAQQTVLEAVTPLNLKMDTLQADEYGQSQVKIEFEVKDPAEEKNFYFIRIFEKGIGVFYTYEGDTIEEPYFNSPNLESPDPILESYCPTWNGCGLLISDDYFDGKSYRLKLIAKAYYSYRDTKNQEFYLVFYHVPESFYLFYKTLENNRNTGDNPFAEPAKVFTNVEGGYGLWSSISPTVVQLKD